MMTRRSVETTLEAVQHRSPGESQDPKDDYKRFADQVKKIYSGQVLVAKDLMEF
jgi:hypothetical protein